MLAMLKGGGGGGGGHNKFRSSFYAKAMLKRGGGGGYGGFSLSLIKHKKKLWNHFNNLYSAWTHFQ